MCETCVNDGSISREAYEMIEAFNERYPEAQHGNGHIVFADCNVKDEHLDYCLGLPLAPEERDFLLLLRRMPIDFRMGKPSRWVDRW